MSETYGRWPGIAAIVGDAEIYCVSCAKGRYGRAAVSAVIEGSEKQVDDEENPLTGVVAGSEDLHGSFCCVCWSLLCEEGCICTQPGQADYWREHGTFQYEKVRWCLW